MDWMPTLDDRRGPVYQRIVEALAADVVSGRLHRGQQLPTHRALAKALGIDLTTVTRAYTEARRCGLTEARVGQGTFVAESMAQVRHIGQRIGIKQHYGTDTSSMEEIPSGCRYISVRPFVAQFLEATSATKGRLAASA